ncbi:ELWxxDGT repeat protein [Dendronalium sp. ChiSLP03b]|uniref:ELWxxDGT repeat protein n=1 Tax=Dendronalium sp. ChiSLP03b TaxID=3075381 RepID=UPI002AD53A04|nr:ELWxxDGT repeat protein [Dendronalium sp. ChiSLP03b]MDZ8205795.1 Calx-beta domain-containing protein [Dendronalium sp. ChiSLP03b]
MANTKSSKLLSSQATLEGNETVLAKPYQVIPGYDSPYPLGLTNINGTLYFFASFSLGDNSDYIGVRLWKSDGTKAGTIPVKDVYSISAVRNEGVEPDAWTNVNGIFYFLKFTTLWRSDGTPEGTVAEVVFPSTVGMYYARFLANINGTLYFSAPNPDSEEYNYDLWKSDGTQEGTFRLKELYPDNSFVNIDSLININDTLYFTVSKTSDDEEGNSFRQTSLWKTDGTTAGTVPLKEFSSDIYFYELITVNNILYFIAGPTGDSQSPELWKSDGTEAGTVKVKDINAGSLINFNDTLYFVGDDGINGYELWTSDGTAEGTVLVKDINPGSSGSSIGSTIFSITEFKDALYFVADNGTSGKELWKSDGTAEGTVLVKDINPGSSDSSIFFFTEINGTLYFYADDGTSGRELWKSDGTAEGTVLVKDINPGSGSSTIVKDDVEQSFQLISVNNTLYFLADDGTHGGELWQSDGTAEGTFLVEDINPGAGSSDIFELTNVNGTLYFNANGRLWALNTNPPVASPIVSITALDANAAETGNDPAVFRISRTGDTNNALTVKYNVDGTATNGQDYNQLNGSITIAAGQSFVDLSITPLADTFPEDSEAVTITLFDKYYQYYIVDSSSNAASATIADDSSTVVLTEPYLVKDILPGPGGSDISYLTKVNETLFFTRFDGTYYELWKSNGTSAGTVFVKDISQDYLVELTNINGIFYFVDYENATLWKSDGTETGTSVVKNYTPSNGYAVVSGLTNLNGSVYFNVSTFNNSDPDSSKSELWKTDATAAGTVLVKDIGAGNLTNFNGTLYFTLFNNGCELWKSDGTEAGTVFVKKITSSSDTPNNIRSSLIKVNDTLYFDVYDRSGKNNGLWKSDGTAAGTVFVKNINPDINNVDYFNNATNVNGTLFFTAYNDTYGNELWKSDGTTVGTVIVKDINPGSSFGNFSNLSNVDGILYFTIDDRLWKSDGTEDGTVLVKDINPESDDLGDEVIYNLINADGTLYFSADDGINGRELWQSDGTTVGTVLVKDLNPGAADSNPYNLIYFNDTLYFTADNGIYGSELWAVKNDNVINGGGSRDPLTGTAGDDRIIGGTGSKTITGGAGDDEFVYTSIREVGQRITDFTVGSDKIVLTQLLDSLVSGGYNGSDAIADGYVKLVQGKTANSTILQIDRDGAIGSAIFRPFIELDNVTPQAMNNLSNFVF